MEVPLDAEGTILENSPANILAWSSKKIKRTARSSFAAETIASVDAADALIFASFLYDEMTEPSGEMLELDKPNRRTGKTFLATDSMNLKDHCSALNDKVAERRLKVDLYSLRENVQRGNMQLPWVDGTQNIADAMTKDTPQALKALKHLMVTGRLPVTHMAALLIPLDAIPDFATTDEEAPMRDSATSEEESSMDEAVSSKE